MLAKLVVELDDPGMVSVGVPYEELFEVETEFVGAADVVDDWLPVNQFETVFHPELSALRVPLAVDG